MFERSAKFESPVCYAVRHSNEDVRMASRSGGVFTALSDQVLGSGGVVYGCVLNKDMEAIHVRAATKEERDLMRGSKYVQSRLGNTFQSVKKDLISGISVLFSGTSCQVAGLYGFLGKDYENLITVDIVCHGVPSPLIWSKYLEWQEKRHNSKATVVDFRNKIKHGWTAHRETISFENGSEEDSRIFTSLFYGHSILRPSCYSCPYKSIIHPGNITIADYWGIDKIAPEFNEDKGVSLVLINDDKGKVFFENIAEDILCFQTAIENSMQRPLVSSADIPRSREALWKDFYRYPFGLWLRLYSDYGLLYKGKKKIRSLLKKLHLG